MDLLMIVYFNSGREEETCMEVSHIFGGLN